jgi:hypothetical protein
MAVLDYSFCKVYHVNSKVRHQHSYHYPTKSLLYNWGYEQFRFHFFAITSLNGQVFLIKVFNVFLIENLDEKKERVGKGKVEHLYFVCNRVTVRKVRGH